MKWIVLSLAWSGVAFLSGWPRWIALVAALVLSHFVIGLWWYRNATPWRRTYFRAIGAFAHLSGIHLRLAEATGEAYSPESAFPALLRNLYPDWTDQQITATIATYQHQIADGSYRREWEARFNEVFASVPASRRNELMIKHFEAADAGLRVRSLIADLIEQESGQAQRALFWRALFAGKVT
jgi:hypothetical protein